MLNFYPSPFTPEESLSNFYRQTPFNPNANWILEICDDKAGDIGALEYVELIFEPIHNTC